MRNVEPEEIEQLVLELNHRYEQRGCPYHIEREKSGYRLLLREEFDSIRARFYGKVRDSRLSQQAIDVLAVVAYRQPVSAAEVQKICRKSCVPVLNQLVKRGLLELIQASDSAPAGKAKKPATYRTTARFLKLFELDTLADLPISDDFDFC